MYKLRQQIKRYGIIGILNLSINYLRTKLLFPQAKIIRFPFEIRGKSQVEIGAKFVTGVGCRLEVVSEDFFAKKKKIIIGNNVQINDNVHIAAAKNITIKDNVLIASKVFISDHNHGKYSGDNPDSPNSIPIERPIVASEILIEENVWIGEFVSILPGVTIGKGSIIGTMSVVTKNIPEYSIAVGSPAKVVKNYNFETQKWEKV